MHADRIDRLDRMLREGRIIRHAWTDGRERACLLAALSPEAGAEESAEACPAYVMPAWLAHLTPWLDDAPSEEAWPRIIQRYAALARRWHALDATNWERAWIGALTAIVREARTNVGSEYVNVLAAIDGVLAWLGRGAPETEHDAAAAAARAAWVAAGAAAMAAAADDEKAATAAGLAAGAVLGAKSAERAVVESAGRAIVAAAEAAVGSSACWAAMDAALMSESEETAKAAAEAAANASIDAAADRIAAGVLDAIEREIEAAEGGR